MSKKLSTNRLRSIGRAYALKALYQNELNPQHEFPRWRDDKSDYWEDELAEDHAILDLDSEGRQTVFDFARRLYEGVVDRKFEIDATINSLFDKGRTLSHTALVERCILRLAVYEMRFIKTPKAVVVSQAMELGNKYGDVKSRAFLNGVLDQFDKPSRKPDADPEQSDAPPTSDV
ncbi:MAG: transcription antitermination factor NusB [Thermoguttaceae bacterium]|jgi:N utilization substance protein B